MMAPRDDSRHMHGFFLSQEVVAASSRDLAQLDQIEQMMQDMHMHNSMSNSNSHAHTGGERRPGLRRGQDLPLRRSCLPVNFSDAEIQDLAELSPFGSSWQWMAYDDEASPKDLRLYNPTDGHRSMEYGGSSLWFLGA
jgi:hypothetical protein